MNTYRVYFRIDHAGRTNRYEVDASHPAVAVRRAMKHLVNPRAEHVDVTCRLYARDVRRHYSDPWVRAV